MARRFTTPVGRVIWGSPTEFDKVVDDNKQPVIDTRTGQQAVEMAFGLAISKGTEREFRETLWGAELYAGGAEAHPQTYTTPRFSWKLRDGDSTEQDENGKRWCDKPHYPGNWVLTLRQRFPTSLFNSVGDIDSSLSILAGDYVCVQCDVRGNTGKKPGVYLNPVAVQLVARGERIASAVSFADTGFGVSNALPPGAKLAEQSPLASGFATPAQTAAAPQFAAPVPVVPNPAILNVPAPVARTMTPKCAGVTYEQFMATGQWTDELLTQHGYML